MKERHARVALHVAVIGVFLCLATSRVAADVVEQPLPNGVVATASYHAGSPRLPAVLVLHGFLQTRNYLTVAGLVTEIRDNGYPVLAPNLSLGITRRKQSLECEAIHAHTLDDDIAEIAAWVAWLKRQGHREIILVGHSSGSLKLLAYAERGADPAVRHLIATSLMDFGADPREMQEAHSALQQGGTELGHYRLVFCNDYVASPAAYLSYTNWDPSRILDAVERLSLPVSVVMGSADRRMEASWPARLRERGAPVHIVEGANHFFGGIHEFGLYDVVIPLLGRETGK